MKEKSIKKGQLLQSKGDLNNKAYQVVSRLLRGYTIDEKDDRLRSKYTVFKAGLLLS